MEHWIWSLHSWQVEQWLFILFYLFFFLLEVGFFFALNEYLVPFLAPHCMFDLLPWTDNSKIKEGTALIYFTWYIPSSSQKRFDVWPNLRVKVSVQSLLNKKNRKWVMGLFCFWVNQLQECNQFNCDLFY